MKDLLVLRVAVKLVLPFIVLFGLYILANGEVSPGGGFQAGMVLACAIILYGLVFGLSSAQSVFPKYVAARMSAGGLLLYGGVAVITLLSGGAILDYSALGSTPQEGQHLGLRLIELGVCITVASVMTLIYYTFAGHQVTRAQ